MAPDLASLLSVNNIIIYMLIVTRLSGFFQSAPFFSGLSAPIVAKLWFCATIAFIFFPLISASKAFILPKDMIEFSIMLIIEFALGYLIGFIANLFLEGIRMSGNILSIQMGLSMSEALDPSTGISSGELSKLYVYLATIVFLATGAYQTLFFTVYNSFSAFPLGGIPFFNETLISGSLIIFAQIFKIGFAVALPIFAVLLVTDILLGMMSKMMPQMNIYMVALPAKIYIGLILLLVFLSATSTYMHGIIQGFINAINSLLI